MFKTVFCRFPGIVSEKTTFEEFEEIYEQIHKEWVLSLIYGQISNEKYVPKHLISLL